MRIGVTYENGQVFQHFGHTEFFKVYDVKTGKMLSKQPFDGFIPYDEFVYVSDDLSVYAMMIFESG